MSRLGGSLLAAMNRLENARHLDTLAHRLLPAIGAFGGSRPAHLLRGKWLGHAFHPLLTDFAEGHWMGATFLDLFGPRGSEAAARRLLGAGLLFSIPTYVTGLAEMTNARNQQERRVGVFHLMSSSASVALYAASYAARKNGPSTRATVLSVTGGLLAFADGYVAGHLGHVQGLGVGATTQRHGGDQ